MQNSRSKGLYLVRIVKNYLEAQGYQVEGPGYSIAFFHGGMKPIHRDYFGAFDLLSVSKDEGIKGHQVCTKQNKGRNVKKIKDLGLSGYLWCKKEGLVFDLYWIGKDDVEYVETVNMRGLFKKMPL